MGTIVARKRANGTVVYLAQIVLKREGKVVHQESRTFDRKPAARGWMERREKALRRPGALEEAQGDPRTLAHAIDTYIEDSVRRIGRTKAQVLRTIKGFPIAQMRAQDIKSEDLVALGQEMLEERQPQTVGNYFSHLASVFAIARPAWGIPLDYQAVKDAQAVLKRLGVIGKSAQRDRRPTLDEMDRLMEHFGRIRARRRDSNPMQAIVAFAVFSTRRMEEITRLEWRDLDGDRIMVRDMKHPGDKIGNDQWCRLTPEAAAIIAAQPRHGDWIFPASPDAISAAFTRACKFLEIDDLHFHDLRHDGISRLFEMAEGIPRVAEVSAHRSWQSLKRYTHLRQVGDKYEGWKWLAVVT